MTDFVRTVGLIVAGAVLFAIAMFVLTLIAHKTHVGDPSGRAAYGFSLIITAPVAAAIGAFAGWFISR